MRKILRRGFELGVYTRPARYTSVAIGLKSRRIEFGASDPVVIAFWAEEIK